MGEMSPEAGADEEPTQAEQVWIDPDDLIDDRALRDVDEDEFRLTDVVEEAASLCKSTAVPATLALYGSWGSGKSSLANLLEQRFADDREVAFARFDAFKYAEVPLRRHFLSQVAEEFGVKDDAFSEGLYTSKKDVRLHLPARKWFGLLVILAIAVALTTLLAAVAAFAIALVSKGGLWSDFTKTLRASVPGVALATPFLATAIALVGRTLTAETTAEAPSSDEQFEALFHKLVEKVLKKTRRKRVVIFIDELDRCSPPQVVTALETLRTFLEVEPCVFVVAADRQALEHAQTEAARQATPLDSANPYYGAGSASLNKIFQYQPPLPPILPRRLSRYALGLIEKRQGVWRRVRNRPELVSVLIPTHVRSPRRVKALLNSFALLYRLALKRAAVGVLDADVEERVAEVAKLACLRTEFPLFARDLQLDARLPDVVLRLHPDPDADLTSEYRGLSAEAIERAKAYAQEKLPVDEVIAQSPAEPGAASDSEAPTTAEVEGSHAKQLIRYLEKTREIASPGRDLVYLESSGAAFGLAAELAQQLEEDAIDGNSQAVAEVVRDLDEAEQQNALRLLSRLIVEAVGIEARNVAKALFAAIAISKGDLAPVADDLLNALVTYNTGYELEAGDLGGALALALSHDGVSARRMREVVLGRDELVEENTLAIQALENLSPLRRHQKRIAQALAGLLERDQGAEAERALRTAADADVTELVDAVPLDDADVINGLQSFIESAQTNGRGDVAFAAFKRLAMSDEAAAVDVVGALVGSFARITDPEAVAGIARTTHARPITEWPTRLGALDPETAKTLLNMDKAVDQYVTKLWTERTAPPSGTPLPDEDFAVVAGVIGRLRPAEHQEDREPLDLVAGVEIACARRTRAAGVEAPTAAMLQALVTDASAAAFAALGRWIDVFEPEPLALYRLLFSRLHGGRALPNELRKPVQAAAATWSPEQKADLLEDVAGAYTEGQVHDTVIRGFGLPGADADRASAALVDAYQATSNNDQRGRLLDLWQIVSPAGTKAERLLVDSVFLPLLKGGKGATRIALDHFALVQNVSTNAARDRLKSGFKTAASDAEDLARRAERIVKNAGWISGKRKWLPWK